MPHDSGGHFSDFYDIFNNPVMRGRGGVGWGFPPALLRWVCLPFIFEEVIWPLFVGDVMGELFFETFLSEPSASMRLLTTVRNLRTERIATHNVFIDDFCDVA